MKVETTSKQCSRCEGKKYVVVTKGDYAVAKRCPSCMTECPECHGDGYIFMVPKQGYGKVKPCPVCHSLDDRIKKFNAIRLPRYYHDKDLANFHPYLGQNNRPENYPDGSPYSQSNGNLPDVRGLVWDYVMGFVPGQKGLLFTGPVGVGKTHLMVYAARYFTLEMGISCRFIEFTHLLSDLRYAYETNGSAADILARLSDVPVLMIDELGKGRKNSWQLSIIDELISKRYNRGLTTFFTTNYAVEENPNAKLNSRASINTDDPDFRHLLENETLVDRVGRRIVSRLKEMTQIVKFQSVLDYRNLLQREGAHKHPGG